MSLVLAADYRVPDFDHWWAALAAGLPRLPGCISPAVESAYRAFHAWLHRAEGAVLVGLDCGHVGRSKPGLAKGTWISCWAVAYPGPGCQTQRKVVRVTEGPWHGINHEHEED